MRFEAKKGAIEQGLAKKKVKHHDMVLSCDDNLFNLILHEDQSTNEDFSLLNEMSLPKLHSACLIVRMCSLSLSDSRLNSFRFWTSNLSLWAAGNGQRWAFFTFFLTVFEQAIHQYAEEILKILLSIHFVIWALIWWNSITVVLDYIVKVISLFWPWLSRV